MMAPQTPRVGAKADIYKAQRVKANRRKSQDLGSFQGRPASPVDDLGLNDLDLADPNDFVCAHFPNVYT